MSTAWEDDEREDEPEGGHSVSHPNASTAVVHNNTMGLKEFSRAVWQKLIEKGETDYHEVAEELLEDIKHEASRARARGLTSDGAHAVDERNVRRRVYDALNVLMAAGVVEKDAAAKKVFWKGSMNEMSQLEALEKEFDARISKVAAKRKMVKSLLLQQNAVKLLIQRNQVAEATVAPGSQTADHGWKLHLPFTVVSAHDNAALYLQQHTTMDVSLTCDAPCTVSAEVAILSQLGVFSIAPVDVVEGSSTALHHCPGTSGSKSLKEVMLS